MGAPVQSVGNWRGCSQAELGTAARYNLIRYRTLSSHACYSGVSWCHPSGPRYLIGRWRTPNTRPLVPSCRRDHARGSRRADTPGNVPMVTAATPAAAGVPRPLTSIASSRYQTHRITYPASYAVHGSSTQDTTAASAQGSGRTTLVDTLRISRMASTVLHCGVGVFVHTPDHGAGKHGHSWSDLGTYVQFVPLCRGRNRSQSRWCEVVNID